MSKRKINVLTVRAKQGQDGRDNTNPIRNLTVARAVQLMEAYPRGDYADVMWTFGAPFTGIECADADYLAIIERRVGSILEMDWDIRQWKSGREEPTDPARAKRATAQAEALRRAYESRGNIYEAIEHLEIAVFRGFSILELAAEEFLPVDHWNVRRDGSRGAWYWNESGKSGARIEDCVRLAPERIIVREVRRPVGRLALLKFIRANLSEQEWDYFVEIYGVPSGVVIAPDGITEETLAEFKTAAGNVAKGADAAFPAGTQYVPNDAPRGIQPFQARLEWLSQKLVQAGTGGYLTMLSMSGSGTLAGSAHMEAFRILSRADARDISETFQEQFDRRVLESAGLLAPGERPLAWFELSAREEQNTKDAADQVVALSGHFDLDPMQVEERTGWKVAKKLAVHGVEKPAGMVQPVETTAAPAIHRVENDDGKAQGVETAAAALLADLEPVRDLIGEALRENGGDLRAAVAAISSGLPGLAEKLKTGALDAVFEGHIAQALVEMLEKQAAGGPRTGRKGETA